MSESATPYRIRRRRVAGWRLPAGAVVVDRTSRWGNPFRVADLVARGQAADEADGRELAVELFRRWLVGEGEQDVLAVGHRRIDRRWIRANLPELHGRVLCCTCSTDEGPCHADVLAELAAWPAECWTAPAAERPSTALLRR